MAAYALDLRKRVLRAFDQGMAAEAVAATYDVSRAWVHRSSTSAAEQSPHPTSGRRSALYQLRSVYSDR
jgi:transposase